MAFLGTLFVFGGYVLVYAAVARGGKFATDPWAGLYTDAYTDSGAAATAADTGSAASAAALPTNLPRSRAVNPATGLPHGQQ